MTDAEKEGGLAPRVDVTPSVAMIDEPVRIALSGFSAKEEVLLRARTENHPWGLDGRWESRAVFLADSSGRVDLVAQAPLSGTYDCVDPMGLFWSMNPLPPLPSMNGPIRSLSETRFLRSTTVVLTAEVNGEVKAAAKLERLLVSQEVRIVDLLESGLVGRFFCPPGSDRRAGVLVLGGSEGGIALAQSFAALLASHGFAALALAYHGMTGLPSAFYEIPLEYFETAIRWMQGQPGIDPGRLSVMGASLGGELCLLLGANFDQLRAVVAYAPSGLVFEGFDRNSRRRKVQSSWSYHGEPLPFVKYSMGRFLLYALWRMLLHKPVQLVPMYRRGVEDQVAIEKATIAVERIRGPVLLISGGDDRIWPSSLFSVNVIERLSRNNFPNPFRHLDYPRAGHWIMAGPYVPTPIVMDRLAFGGNPKENANACRDSWPQVLQFLRRSL